MYSEITNIAIISALEAGKLLKTGFGTTFTISNKEGRNNLVTEYDKKSEELIINTIRSNFPDHNFWAEESGVKDYKSDQITWVIDPLDGTVNFAHNLPIFSISIAAIKGNNILNGIIYNPVLDELFVSEVGKGSFLNDKSITVSSNSSFENSFLVTGFPYNVEKNPCNCINHFISIIKNGIPVRRLGSAALDLAYVACGRFDGFWEINLNPWDVAAGALLVREAGGLVTQYNLNDYWIENQSIIATNGLIHHDISKTLSQCSCGIQYEH